MPGLDLPADFPAAAHARVRDTVVGARTGARTEARTGSASERGEGHGAAGEARREFEGAWTACAHRFLGLARHDDAFAASLRRGGRHAEGAELHAQEEALFGFVSSGVAVAESLGYALYAIAALVHPERYPIATPTDRRNATLGATMRGYAADFADEGVTRVLFWRLNSHEFGWWKDVRALLAHRSIPGRWPDEGGPEASVLHGAWMLRGEPVDDGTTARRRAWLAQAVAEIVGETESLVARRLAAR